MSVARTHVDYACAQARVHGARLGSGDLRCTLLVNDYVQAWRYGPVIPSIYYSFRPHGVYGLNPIPLVQESDIDDETDNLIAVVYALYEDLSANQLSALTHIKGGPWHTKYEPGKRGIIIPNEMIAEHFRNKLERSRNGEDA